MKALVLLTALAMLGCSGGHPAYAYTVYPGCTVPTSTTGKVWWVDPVNGKSPAAGGLGTQAAPWDNLSGIMSGSWMSFGGAVPGYPRPLLSSVPYTHRNAAGTMVDQADTMGNPPVNGGDTIMLMSGDYGDIQTGAYLMGQPNTDFITVKAAPGQSPVFDTLWLHSTTKWVFDGIKIQSVWGTRANHNPLIGISDQGPGVVATADIILQNLDVSSADDAIASQWTQAQWASLARTAFYDVGGAGNGTNGQPNTSCVSLTASHIHNTRVATTLMSNNSLLANNEIDHFGDDGLDYGASNITVSKNYVHDNLNIGDGNHEDGMQGVEGPGAAGVTVTKYSNVVIDSNVIIRQTDPALKFPSYRLGLDAFDSDWTNLTVTNNVVVTGGVCWGMSFSSVHDSLIAGNTVEDDGQVPAPGCAVELAVGGSSHEGTVASNTRVTSNLARTIVVGGSAADVTVTSDNNVATGGSIAGWDATKATFVYYEPVGTDSRGNVTLPVPTDLTKIFKVWSPATHTFDMHLIAGSPAIGHGVGIPAIDITGAARVQPAPPMTAGAYSYRN